MTGSHGVDLVRDGAAAYRAQVGGEQYTVARPAGSRNLTGVTAWVIRHHRGEDALEVARVPSLPDARAWLAAAA